jgi:hypothetical protein
MIDGIEQAFNGINKQHTTPFGFEEQRDICSMFDSVCNDFHNGIAL